MIRSAPVAAGAAPCGTTPQGDEPPFRVNGADDGGSHQAWCPRPPLDAGADRCPRCGVLQPGNRAALQHGAYSQQLPAEVQDHVHQLIAGATADLGGAEGLSTIERAYVAKLGDVEALLTLLAADMRRRGVLTEAGGVRKVYEQYLAGLDRWDRLAQRLGTARRARAVRSPAAAIMAAPVVGTEKEERR